MLQLSKIYSIKPIRLSIKLGICLLGVKAAGDFFFYLLSGQTLTFPRYTFQEGPVQHIVNPPVMLPYPWKLSMKQVQDNRVYEQYIAKIYEIVFNKQLLQQKMYKNVPEREDPNEIDHFMRYAEASRIIESLYTRALRKMSDSGAEIPDGINQRIRELSQWKFKGYTRIQPQL